MIIIPKKGKESGYRNRNCYRYIGGYLYISSNVNINLYLNFSINLFYIYLVCLFDPVIQVRPFLYSINPMNGHSVNDCTYLTQMNNLN